MYVSQVLSYLRSLCGIRSFIFATAWKLHRTRIQIISLKLVVVRWSTDIGQFMVPCVVIGCFVNSWLSNYTCTIYRWIAATFIWFLSPFKSVGAYNPVNNHLFVNILTKSFLQWFVFCNMFLMYWPNSYVTSPDLTRKKATFYVYDASFLFVLFCLKLI